jgi:cholesterol transport system auxiliary component
MTFVRPKFRDLRKPVILRSRRRSAGPKDLNRCVSKMKCAGAGSRLLRATLTGAITLLSIGLSGCGAARPAKYYELTLPAENVADPSGEVYPVTILMGPILCSHLYREDHIVYSSEGQTMGIYEYQRWAEPPSEMIQDVLLRALRSSGRFRSIYAQRSSMRGDYLLRGHLWEFKEVTAPSLSARFALELELRDTKTGDTVWNHLYNHDEPVSGKSVSAVVAALNRNVQRATNEFLVSITQYFSAHPPAPPPAAQ